MFHKMNKKQHCAAAAAAAATTRGNSSSMFWSHKPTLNAKRFSVLQTEVSGVDPFTATRMMMTLPYERRGGGIVAPATAATRAAAATTTTPSQYTPPAGAADVGGVLNDLLHEMDQVLVGYDHHHHHHHHPTESSILDTTTTKTAANPTAPSTATSSTTNMNLQDATMRSTMSQLHQPQQRMPASMVAVPQDDIGMFLLEPTPIATAPTTTTTTTTTTTCCGRIIQNRHETTDTTTTTGGRNSSSSSSSSCLDQSFSQLVKSFDPSSMDFFIKQLQHTATATTSATTDLDHHPLFMGGGGDGGAGAGADHHDDLLLEELHASNSSGLFGDVTLDNSSDIFRHPATAVTTTNDDNITTTTTVGMIQDNVPSSSSCGMMIDDNECAIGGVGSSTYSFFKPEQWEERYQELMEFRNQFGHCLVPHNWEPNRALAQWVKRQRYQYKLKMKNLQQEEQEQQDDDGSSSTTVDLMKWNNNKALGGGGGGGGGTMKRSTLTALRQQKLESIGFIWSTHNVLWEEKYVELQQFLKDNGHCNVPSKYPTNPKLSVWVRCQRRQYKLLMTKGKGRDVVGSGTAAKKTKKNSNKTKAVDDEHEQSSSMTLERISKLKVLGFNFNPRNLKV